MLLFPETCLFLPHYFLKVGFAGPGDVDPQSLGLAEHDAVDRQIGGLPT